MNLSKQDIRFKKYLNDLSTPEEYIFSLLLQRKKSMILTYVSLALAISFIFLEPIYIAFPLGSAIFSYINAASCDNILKSILLIDRFGNNDSLEIQPKFNSLGQIIES
ncbi:MAG: hypothetical protein COA79_26335 [Planctomycetota bacterium]|nr:MAG: hypothetical protein COA79_26335 [Planctomycetota bacterium]